MRMYRTVLVNFTIYSTVSWPCSLIGYIPMSCDFPVQTTYVVAVSITVAMIYRVLRVYPAV